MSGHTPGPWTFAYENADHSGGGCWYEVSGPAGSDLLWFPYTCSDDLAKRKEANARLMAAAPDLLDFAKYARALFSAIYDDNAESVRLADAAIAKATGGEA